MIYSVNEQRNPYKGTPPRPWVRAKLIAVSGDTIELDLLADTGNPFAVIVGESMLRRFVRGDLENIESNFGDLRGAWLRLAIPHLGFERLVPGYGSDAVEEAARASHEELAGLVGLPLLRQFDYGGDDESFWIREPLLKRTSAEKPDVE
jgi:hypothetical protein